MNDLKFLKVFTDGTEKPSRFCLENIKGNFIVVEQKDASNHISLINDHLPEEFTTIIYMDDDRIREEIDDSLDFAAVFLLDIDGSTRDYNTIEEHVIESLIYLKSLCEHGWQIDDVTLKSIFLSTEFEHYSIEDIDEFKTNVNRFKYPYSQVSDKVSLPENSNNKKGTYNGRI
ncbi:hypothetical protein ACFL7D_04780 [candidate division KSB1 bacterium]